MKNTSASTNDIVGTCIGQSEGPLDNRLAVTLDETQQIFGRGILRIQTHGPRHTYFMTFLPEAPFDPSKMRPDRSSRPADCSGSTSS